MMKYIYTFRCPLHGYETETFCFRALDISLRSCWEKYAIADESEPLTDEEYFLRTQSLHNYKGEKKPVNRDVTALVDFYNNDDEFLPVLTCVCGEKFAPWDFMISVYREDAKTCPKCKRKLYFMNNIRVFEVIDG